MSFILTREIGSVIPRPAQAESRPLAEGLLEELAPGAEYGTIPWIGASPDSDSLLHVIRFDPELWSLEAFSTGDEPARTPRHWASEEGLVFVTNAGMYGEDGREHVGYFRTNGEVFTSYRHPKYESVLAFDPIDHDDPFAILDLDEHPFEDVLSRYDSVIQNLRLIKSPGENRWSAQTRQWSEMCVAEDEEGRIVFLFTSVPISMYEWNGWLLSLPLGIRAAQHLEGGGDAQFYLNIGNTEILRAGATRLGLHLGRKHGTPVPNVLGISAR